MIQTQENGEKPYFGPDLGLLGQNSGRHFFFFQKSGFASHYISWSAIIMYNIRKNQWPNLEKT